MEIMRNANHIVHQKIVLMQVRQAVLLCYLQILRRFLISFASSTQFEIGTTASP
jgi:hypothetical protein